MPVDPPIIPPPVVGPTTQVGVLIDTSLRTSFNIPRGTDGLSTFDVLSFGADPTGVQDSTAAFAACFSAASVANSGDPRLIHIPPGSYSLSGTTPIATPNNTTVQAYGATITWTSGSCDSGMFSVNTPNRVIFRGGKFILGAGVTSGFAPSIIGWTGAVTESSGVQWTALIEDCFWEGNSLSGSGGILTANLAIYKLLVRNCIFSNFASAAIQNTSASSRYITIEKCTGYNTGGINVAATLSTLSALFDSHFYGGPFTSPSTVTANVALKATRVERCSNQYSIGPSAAITGVTVSNCYVNGANTGALAFTGILVNQVGASVIGCYVTNCAGGTSGTSIAINASFTGAGVIFANNVVTGISSSFGSQGITVGSGISRALIANCYIANCTDTQVVYFGSGQCTMQGCLLESTTGSAELAVNASSGAFIATGNILVGANVGTTVGLQTSGGNLQADGNRFIDLPGNNVIAYGAANAHVTNNWFSSSFANTARWAVNNSSTGTVIAADNRIDNQANFGSGAGTITAAAAGTSGAAGGVGTLVACNNASTGVMIGRNPLQ